MGRGRWDSRVVFILAAVGSAIGLGNVWRFPYLAGKYGGGAFLIPYLLALFLIGVPLMMVEFAIGQKMQQGAIGSFKKIHTSFGGLGVFALFCTFVLTCYYAVIMAWSLIYFFASFGLKWAGNSQDYFYKDVLQLTDTVNVIGGINWPIFFALIAIWIMIYFCVWKGVKSVGKVVWITVPLPIILLGVLLIRAITLPGSLDGWAFYLMPDFTALLDSEVWLAAFSQIFFTLTLAFGVMITYSSYKSDKADVVKDSWVTSILNCSVSLFAGFVVFGILGYMATQTSQTVAEIAASGPGLAFVVFPEALSLMPLPWLFSAIFFLTLLTLGIDSAFSLVEAINVAILDKKKNMTTQRVSLWVCCAMFLGGVIFTTRAGLYFLDIVDHFLTNFNLVIVGMLQAILIGWIYGPERLRKYMNEVSDWKIGKWWNYSIKYLIPIVLTILLVKQFITEIRFPYEGYPGWALGIGWLVVLIPLITFFFLMFTDKERIRA